MKIQNILVIGAILLILYLTVGASFLDFYTGGKEKVIESAEYINKLCNENGACPETLAGWQKQGIGALSNGPMLYFVDTTEGDADNKVAAQTFRIVYSMIMPDNWFEADGGVGKQVSYGWKSR